MILHAIVTAGVGGRDNGSSGAAGAAIGIAVLIWLIKSSRKNK